MEDTIIKILSGVSWPAGIALSAYFMRPMWEAFSNYFNNKTDNNKIKNLELFQAEAEGNHFTDLDRLLKDNDNIWKVMNSMQEAISKTAQDVAYIMGKIGNGHKK